MSHETHFDLVNAGKHTIDAAAAGTIGLTFIDKLPEIAAGCAVIWYLIRFFEYGMEKYKKYKEKKNERQVP